jgi:outer membrane murein-binding lipoprotein Lpp
MPRLTLAAACAALLLLTGCRTYGDYDQTELTYEALKQTVANFGQTVPRLEAEAQALRRTPGVDSALVHAFDALVTAAQQVHARGQVRVQAFADDHDGFVLSEWVGSSTYRRLNEAFGATTIEQAQVMNTYHALAAIAGGRPDTTSYLAAAVGNARYSVVPGLYYRIANANRTVSVVGAARAPRPALPAAATPGPDTTRTVAPALTDTAAAE